MLGEDSEPEPTYSPAQRALGRAETLALVYTTVMIAQEKGMPSPWISAIIEWIIGSKQAC